jgi:hypothetical protein
MKRSLSTALAIAMCALAACGGDDGGGGGGGGEGGDYPPQAEENFMKACTSQPQATEAYCQCTFDEITANVSFEDFQEAEQQIGSGGINDAPPETREAFQAAVEKCRSEIE